MLYQLRVRNLKFTPFYARTLTAVSAHVAKVINGVRTIVFQHISLAPSKGPKAD
jgi:hypothetical protein